MRWTGAHGIPILKTKATPGVGSINYIGDVGVTTEELFEMDWLPIQNGFAGGGSNIGNTGLSEVFVHGRRDCDDRNDQLVLGKVNGEIGKEVTRSLDAAVFSKTECPAPLDTKELARIAAIRTMGILENNMGWRRLALGLHLFPSSPSVACKEHYFGPPRSEYSEATSSREAYHNNQDIVNPGTSEACSWPTGAVVYSGDAGSVVMVMHEAAIPTTLNETTTTDDGGVDNADDNANNDVGDDVCSSNDDDDDGIASNGTTETIMTIMTVTEGLYLKGRRSKISWLLNPRKICTDAHEFELPLIVAVQTKLVTVKSDV